MDSVSEMKRDTLMIYDSENLEIQHKSVNCIIMRIEIQIINLFFIIFFKLNSKHIHADIISSMRGAFNIINIIIDCLLDICFYTTHSL